MPAFDPYREGACLIARAVRLLLFVAVVDDGIEGVNDVVDNVDQIGRHVVALDLVQIINHIEQIAAQLFFFFITDLDQGFSEQFGSFEQYIDIIHKAFDIKVLQIVLCDIPELLASALANLDSTGPSLSNSSRKTTASVRADLSSFVGSGARS